MAGTDSFDVVFPPQIKTIDFMWNFQRMSFYVESLHQFNNFFGRVKTQPEVARKWLDMKKKTCRHDLKEKVQVQVLQFNHMFSEIRQVHGCL